MNDRHASRILTAILILLVLFVAGGGACWNWIRKAPSPAGRSAESLPALPAHSGQPSAGQPTAFPRTGMAGLATSTPASGDAASTPAPQPGESAIPASTREETARTIGRSIPDILKDADLTDPATRARVVAEIEALQTAQRESVEEKARRLGIPLRIDGPGRKVSILHDFRGDEPLYRTTLNANAAISTGANLLAPAPYGLTGSGVKTGVWDGGSVLGTHVELAGRITRRNNSAAYDDHATHVAGTIAASGVQPAAKGMAPQSIIDSYDWNSDYAEMTAASAVNSGDTAGIPFSNHSYGYNAVTSDMGRYESEAAAVDAVAASLPFFLPFWAAGNEQDLLTAKGGFQSITFNGLAKNVMTVGAVSDAVAAGVRSPSNAVIASFSSLGPCDDGRIKPDVVANGVTVRSSVASGNNAYDGTYSGTSMATPNALGSAILLQQLHAREFSGRRMRASTVKSLIIHTADDRGSPGPDYTYGWGLVNVKAAADLILSHQASLASPKMIEGTLTNTAKTATHSFTWDGVSPIRATLCWTDPAGTAQTNADSRTANLRHNLDAKLTAPDGITVYQPYVMPFVGNWSTASMSASATTGKNNVDTVEQVYLATPSQPGTYTVTVSLDGTLATASQVYSLIVTGGTNVESNPPPNVALTSPATGSFYLPGAPVSLSATAGDLAIGGAPGAVAQVEFFNGNTLLGTDTAAPYSLEWTPSSAGVYSITAKATDNEGASAVSAAALISVLGGDGAPVVSSFTPSSAPAGAVVTISGSNFAGIAAVRFNGVDTTFTVNSSGQITAIVPATASSGLITVVNAYGTGTGASPFTVLVSPILISQIYGAGGNSGATFNRDYVELHNRGDASVSLDGWALQYASASGTSWTAVNLTGIIAPGRYHLIGLGTGSSGVALPAVDVSGNIAMAATAGKIALTDTTTVLTGSSPVGNTAVRDFVGYGAANASEGSPAPAPSTTTAIFRAGGGATDTDNNSADFTAGFPAPRNSSSGAPVPPVITSGATATGTVNAAFTYQITASNTPTSFGASGLPAGLSVNTLTGAVTGTPSAAGTTNATITATNGAGTASANLAITINPAGGGSVLLSEDFSSITSGNNTSSTGSGTSWPGNTNFPNVSQAYQAGGAVKLGSGSASGSLTSRTLDLGGNGGRFTVSFKVKGWTTVEGGIKVTPTGIASQTVSYTSVMSGSFETRTINFTGGQANSTIRFETTANRAYLDDIVVSHTLAANPPVIAAAGAPASVDAVYGSASPAPASFAVSGTDMTAGILVTPPPGFEVSQTAGGVTGYAATQLVGAAGAVPSTEVFIRLAAGTNAGSYSGNISLTSAGASPVSIPIADSEVRPKLLTITADNRSKPYGATLTLGPGQTAFSASGLVGSETVGSVTLAATGGTAAGDAPGIYQIIPSAATGGSFTPANYDIDYQDGTLAVTGRTYDDWLAARPGLADNSPAGDPDGDGFSNLLEFFAGLDPALRDGPVVLSTTTGPASFSMTYRRAKGNAGVAGAVRRTSDLAAGPWTTTDVTETAVDKGSYDEVTATITRTRDVPRLFLQLTVSQP